MNKPVKAFLTIVGLIALVYILWYLRVILLYFIIAAVISIVGSPLVKKISKIKIGKIKIGGAVGALVTLLLFIGFFISLVSLLSPLIAEQAKIISSLDLDKISASLQDQLVIFQSWASQFNSGEDFDQTYILSKLRSLINFDWISGLFDNIIGVLGDAFVAVFSILFISFFLLKDGSLLTSILYSLTPDEYLPKVKKIMENNNKMLTSYLTGVLIQIFITATVVSLGLYIIGVQNALIIGIIAGFMNVIPYIGPIFGMAIGLTVAITTNLGLDTGISIYSLSLKVLLVFGIAQLVDNFFTQPVILSKSVNAHPLEIFLVISAAGTLGGMGGMIAAIPTYTVIKIIASEFLTNFKFVKSLTKNTINKIK